MAPCESTILNPAVDYGSGKKEAAGRRGQGRSAAFVIDGTQLLYSTPSPWVPGGRGTLCKVCLSISHICRLGFLNR